MTKIYAADTHALYWYVTGSKRLSKAVAEVFQEVEVGKARLSVSTVALAELFYLLRKHRKEHLFPDIIARLKASLVCQIEQLELKDVQKLPAFSDIPEMHDRLIAIHASNIGATLLTRDASLENSRMIDTLW